MEYLQLACPYCGGEFSAAVAAENRTKNCPRCDREVTIPAASSPSPPAQSEPPTLPPPPPAPPPAEPPAPRRLSPTERARARRRLSAVVAIAGMAILAAVLMVLLRLRP